MSRSQKKKLRSLLRLFGELVATAFAVYGLYFVALVVWILA